MQFNWLRDVASVETRQRWKPGWAVVQRAHWFLNKYVHLYIFFTWETDVWQTEEFTLNSQHLWEGFIHVNKLVQCVGTHYIYIFIIHVVVEKSQECFSLCNRLFGSSIFPRWGRNVRIAPLHTCSCSSHPCLSKLDLWPFGCENIKLPSFRVPIKYVK